MITGDYYKDLRTTGCIAENIFPPLKGEKNEEYAREMRGTESVALHIRRGDFVRLGWAYSLDVWALAVKAMDERVKNPVYFLFSDDLPFCREHIEELGLLNHEVVFVEGNKKPNNYIDMQLMTICKHRIVPNSSFSFCAALLRENREGVILNLNSGREIF